MNKKSLKKLGLMGLLVVGSARATEMRTPWLADRGPIRYTFDKLYDDRRNITTWSAAHFKEAHKAFLKHGTDSKPLTALIYNKADFTLNEIFPNSEVPFGYENYSPYLKLTSISPRVHYTEYGMTFGGRIDWPVNCNKGRVGLRATLPMRRIEWERDDNLDKNQDPLSQFKVSQVINIDRNTPSSDIDAAAGAAAAAAGAAGNGNAGGDAARDAINVQQVGGTASQAVANAMVLNAAVIANAIDGVIPVGSVFAGSASAPLIGATAPAGGNFGNNTAAAIDATDATVGQVVAAALATRANGGALANAAGVQAVINNGNNTAAINRVGNRGNRAAVGQSPDVVVNAYRLDFVASLERANHTSGVVPGANSFQFFGQQAAVSAAQKNRATIGLVRSDDAETLVQSGAVAWMPAPASEPTKAHVAVADITQLNANLNNALTVDQVGYFQNTVNYSGIADATTGLNQAGLDQAKNLWVVFRRAADANNSERFAQNPTGSASAGQTVANQIENLLQLYRINPLIFFEQQGYTFDDQIRNGIGDIDLDLFYEHKFSDCWVGELAVGVKFPTGGDKDKYGTPWPAVCGNGQHWEVKLAGLIAYQPYCWMNVKIDASYNFVLEATEHRMAAFKGAQIKNFGPRADADVDWGYFIGHVDMNFFHPKTQDVRTTVGYEIYYKTEDHLKFKKSSAASWLGKKFVGGAFVEDLQPLDNGLARKNTNSIGHKLRTETSCQINQYFELYAGGSWTFAGQNVMKDRDLHGGFTIRY